MLKIVNMNGNILVTFAGARSQARGIHKTRVFNNPTGNTDHRQGRQFKDRQTLTERTGAFKDRITRELRRHTWDQIKQST